MSKPRGTFTEEEAWERSSFYAAPGCRRCKGQGTYWIYMGGEQSAIHLCWCVRHKAGFVGGIHYGTDEQRAEAIRRSNIRFGRDNDV